MHVACKCLNVSIKSRGNELQRVKIEDYELTATELADPFFRENVATVGELEGITKELPGLVEVRNIGAWAIHRCINCLMNTHAVHRERGAALVLINTNVLKSADEIARLTASPSFSSIFRIMIDNNNIDTVDFLQPPNKFSVSQLPSNLQSALGGLQQQLETAVQREVAATEERVRAFSAEQYQLLEQYRERAHTEHRLLVGLICNQKETEKPATMEISRATSDTIQPNIAQPMSNALNTRPHTVASDTKIIGGPNIRHQAATKHPANLHLRSGIDKKASLRLYSKEPSSYDAEALFTLEGMDDSLPSEQAQQSEEESDTDDSGHDEGIHIPRGQRGGHPTLAKSLPVSVPVFPSFTRQIQHDQGDDQLSRDPHDPHNIRASMKALAKSVHGDTVFGDLPRPRFSTQI
ncbi:uncharacterized protein LOC124412631 [Diprion similis]|uniref:uncharacterized protein LOC124412631 n=1 Tax=Diprion similis TaxID=362088 RepID=UPI001EF8A603|nr:uncharacterized protein LOC124412631 [Diprion similis]